MSTISSYDNDYRIIHSETANIYSNKMLIKNIYWYDFTFNFKKDENIIETWIDITPDDEKKTVIVNLKNFSSPLGVWTTLPIQILSLLPEDSQTEKAVYFSVFARSLSDTTSFLQVTISFYAK